jgi:cation transport ATPase
MVELKDFKLKIKGMDCPSCAMNVENAFNTSEIREAIEKAGYNALEDEKDDHKVSCSSCSTDIFEEELPLWKQRNIRIIAISSVLLVLGLSIEYVTGTTALSHILFLFAGVISGYSIAKKGISSPEKTPDMNFPDNCCCRRFLHWLREEGASVLSVLIAEF